MIVDWDRDVGPYVDPLVLNAGDLLHGARNSARRLRDRRVSEVLAFGHDVNTLMGCSFTEISLG